MLKILQEVKIGPKYEIYYNPDDPADSYFTHAYEPPGFWDYVKLVLAIVSGLLLIRFGVSNLRSSKKTKVTPAAKTEDKNERPQ